MGLIYAVIELANAKNGSLKSMAVKALVDTGAMTLCIPEHIAIQLQLQEIEKREVSAADERSHTLIQFRSGLRIGRASPAPS